MAYMNVTTAPSLFDRIRDGIATLQARHERNRLFRKTLNELSALSNRELADLGLSRSELPHIAWECTTR